MEKIKKCNESIDNPPSKDCIKDGALAQVLGLETSGRVRGLGLLLHPLKLVYMFKNSGNNVENLINAHIATPQSEQPSNDVHNDYTYLVNTRCLLLNWFNFGDNQVVAE